MALSNRPKTLIPPFPSLPHLFVSKATGAVVLFTGNSVGTVVDTGTGVHPIGHHSTSWAGCDEVKYWEPLAPGKSVTIYAE